MQLVNAQSGTVKKDYWYDAFGNEVGSDNGSQYYTESYLDIGVAGTDYINVSEMAWTSMEYDIAPAGAASVPVCGQWFEKSINAHSWSRIALELNGQYTVFTSSLGLHDGSFYGNVIYRIIADEKEIYNSGSVKSGELKNVSIDVRDVNILCLRLTLMVSTLTIGLVG